MNKIKNLILKQILVIQFQIGVNVIGLPQYYTKQLFFYKYKSF